MLALTQFTGFNARRRGPGIVRGTGTAGLVLGLAGAGDRHRVGAGVAGITLGAAGVGALTSPVRGTGVATLTLGLAGAGLRHTTGAGTAAIVLGAAGAGTVTGGMTIVPVAYWKLDEASGTRVDSAGTNDLSPGGGTYPTYGAGKLGNCSKSYSATGFSFLSVPDSVLLRPATPISVAGWVKAEYMGPNPQAVFEIADINGGSNYYGANSRWGVAIEDSTLKFWVTNYEAAGYDMATRDLTGVGTDAWFFFAAVIRDGDLCLSINGGTEDVVTLNSVNLPEIAKDFVVGCLSGPGYTLEIDELGVFDFALSAGDITDLYNGGGGVTYNP